MIAALLRAWRQFFRAVTPAELAAEELAAAERELLGWHTARENATSNVEFNEQRIKRLKKTLAGLEKESAT